MKNILCLFVFYSFVISALAQESPAKSYRFEAEIDPIAYALHGYSVHGIFVKNKIRTDVGFFGIRQPEGYSSNKDFRIQSGGVGMKMQYLVNKSQTWFVGIGTGYYENIIEHLETNQRQIHKIYSIGINAGYRWFLFKKKENFIKNLYLSPWASFDYNKPMNHVKFEGLNYKQSSFSIFPTIHIGYKF